MATTRTILPRLSSLRQTPRLLRALHSSPTLAATPLPITAHGPPPKPPLPSLSDISAFRNRQKAATLGNKATRKFWKDVHVVPVSSACLHCPLTRDF